MLSRSVFRILACTASILSTANAQWWRGGDGNGENQRPPYWGGNADEDNGSIPYWQRFRFSGSTSGQRALIAHAVLASLVWVFLIPIGGILLRLNISSPWVLRAHAILQVSSYVLFVVAAGLGIYLVQHMDAGGYLSLWHEPHVQLGIAVLILTLFQPILGVIHHTMFKRRVANAKDGKPGPSPGRTLPGHIHLWLGRILILLGMTNGGLGIQLAWLNPFQSTNDTTKICIAYSLCAGIVGVLYLIVVIRFEVTKARGDRDAREKRSALGSVEEVPPTYVESQESFQRHSSGITRYG